MDTKTKIIKILPFWFTALLLFCAAVILPVLFKADTSAAVASAQSPQVLGESTVAADIRGDAPPATQLISEIAPVEASSIKAHSFLVFDLASGQDLLVKNNGEKFAIASLTKLMTGLVAYNNSNLNSSFAITNKDRLDVSPSLGLEADDSVLALDVFNAMLIGSNNDAALALANHTAGQNFVSLMNKQAQDLGMANTSYANPLGFDNSDNYSTADDLKLLITQTQKLAAFTDLGRRTSYKFTGSLEKTYSTVATNTLLKDHPDIQAIKTGFTAGANGAMATKIQIGSHQIVILVLDSGDREGDTLKLKNLVSQDFSVQ